ncbi:hypothetical protein [Singulisphaera sp. PoT]|uniref:hypothetical protein n=1 Tax=Singulisphaera sp. PoT TaxID=3411797 RepID=UPI003BF549DC
MIQYIVHLYREMRLTFEGIEAKSCEAAAHIARDKLTGDAEDIADCDGETLSALVDVADDAQYEQSCMIDFEPERLRKAAPALLDALTLSEGMVQWAFDHGADSEATAAILISIRTAIASAMSGSQPSENQPYSVLLLYPDYANLSGADTYYAFVKAPDPLTAVARARRDAAALESARSYGGSTRRHFMRKRARRACDAYTGWCNGEIYGYEIVRIANLPCGGEQAEPFDSGWGFLGLEGCRAAAREACSHGGEDKTLQSR